MLAKLLGCGVQIEHRGSQYGFGYGLWANSGVTDQSAAAGE